MDRKIFTEEHKAFRKMVRTFVEKEVVPYHEQWEKDGMVSRELWLAAGKAGLIGFGIPEEYGGGGVEDFRYNMIFDEELARVGASGVGIPLQNDVVEPYLMKFANAEQHRRWFPGICAGEIITAIAMTEPGTGSDLQGIKTTAIRDGDYYVLNGSKTFITNGQLSDLVIVAARTDAEAGSRGFSLLVVERGMAGFERGRNLDKVGMKAQDTSELFFSNVRVPKENLIGEEGMGFFYLVQNLAQERLTIAVSAVAGAEHALQLTIDYCKQRQAFGKAISNFQNTRFELAEIATEVEIARTFLDRCVEEHVQGNLQVPEAAMAKWWTTDLLVRTVNRCVQLHGGYGYMLEYPIAKAYLDCRPTTIFGGTNEIMKEIIGRSLLS